MEGIRKSVSFKGDVIASESLKVPLLQSQDTFFTSATEISEYSVDVVETEVKLSFIGGAVLFLLAAGVATSALAMIEVHQIVVYVAGALSIVNAPIVAVAQYKIAKKAGLRAASNSLRHQAELLKEERRILNDVIHDFSQEIDSLAGIEDDLNEICNKQGYKCDTIVALVKENEDILTKMRRSLRETAMTDITRIVLSCDRNHDMKINERELADLVLALRIRLEVQGIDLDEQKFKAMVRRDDDIANIITVLGENMFHDDEEDFDQDKLNSSTEGEEESLLSMFVIQDRYTKGSIARARGSSVSLCTRSDSKMRGLSFRQNTNGSDVSRKLSRTRLTLVFDV